MELSIAQQLEGIVEKLVTSGATQLDEPLLKKLKNLCKHSDDNVKHTFHILLSQLQKDHSEIRFSAFQIIHELFMRSHIFRLLLIENVQEYMDLTMGVDFNNPLPPPRLVADKLKQESLRAFKTWHSKYGIAYSKLSLAFTYLSDVKKVKFDQPEPQHNSTRQIQQKQASRKEIVNGIKLDKLKLETDKSMWEIIHCIKEIQSGLKLLIPDFNDDDDNDNNVIDKTNVKSTSESVLREAGLPGRGYNVELDLTLLSPMHVSQTEDNSSVVERIKDCVKSANRIHLPRLRKWLNVASKCEASSDFLKNIIDIKARLKRALKKYGELDISAGEMHVMDDDSDCDEFVEVPELQQLPRNSSNEVNSGASSSKSQIQKRNNAHKAVVNKNVPLSDTNVWKPLASDTSAEDPTSYQYALAVRKRMQQSDKNSNTNLEQSPKNKMIKIMPSSAKSSLHKGTTTDVEKLKAKAPVISFGKDLLAWDHERKNELKEMLKLGASKAMDIGHRFWSGVSASQGDSGVSDAALTALTTRTMEFSGTFERVVKSCRAPLPNGKLCPRQDRFKCPFHGKIIDRDLNGNPVIKDGQQPSTSSSSGEALNNPKLNVQKDVEHALDGKAKLILKKKSTPKKSKKSSHGLTDLSKINDNSRYRLQRKVLNAGSLKRVAGTLNSLDTKRSDDKFGDNFNYALH